MIEKELEDLLWEYPEKFLNEPLEQFRRQPGSSVGRADLVFKDRLGRLLVVELKKETLSRQAVGQLVDYFGMLKLEFGDTPVELMAVANRIPPERRLACSRYDIEYVEISAKKFRDVASEVGYEFESERRQFPQAASSETLVHPTRTRSMPGYPFDPAQLGYQMDESFSRSKLAALVEEFEGSVCREIDRSLAKKLRRELLDRSRSASMEKGTFLQLAKWCKTDNPLYWGGMDVAQRISELLFGRVIDRRELGV